MTPPPQYGPWGDHRMLAESIAQAIADALGSMTGSPVEIGKVAAFEPENSLPGRPVPLRAIVVNFRRPLRDSIIFLTSYKDEVVRPLVEAAAEATIAALDVPTSPDQHGPLGRFDVDEVVEYDTIDLAIEQTDALYLEAGYLLDLPLGELLMVIGTGLLESAACFVAGTADPFAEEAAFVPASTDLELGGEIGANEAESTIEMGGDLGIDGTGPRYELGDESIGAGADPQLVTGAAAAASDDASGIDAYDAMLAAQEQAEADAAATIAAAATDAAVANAAAAQQAPMADVAATERWTQLLSGVEVELSAELGRTDLALGDITALDSDSVLTLDQLVHEPVDVYVNGTRYARARLVVVDGEYGIEIIEVVEQDLLATALAA